MTDIATRTPQQELVARVRGPQFLEQVTAALPGNVQPERFVRVTITAINQYPDLIAADPATLFNSLIRCAQDGLLPDGREAAIVVFGGKAQYMPMIGGFRKIAAEHGWAIDTQVVYKNDVFKYRLGLNPTLTHEPPDLDKERGEKIGAYAVCTHADGRKQVEVMGRADILRVKAVSKQKTGILWTTWEDRAWEKTVGRRAFAKVPLGGRDQERVTRVIQAADTEFDLHDDQPRMTIDEANLSAAIGTTVAPRDSGPDDSIEDAEVTEVQTSYTDLIPDGAMEQE